MIAAIIQARMTSTRLPGKVLANICGKPALERMLHRVQESKLIDEIVVATTRNTTDDPIIEVCERTGTRSFRGDEHDVLGRYQEAAREVAADAVVRLTADCPLIDPGLVDEVINMFNLGSWDYVSNARIRTYPDGLDAEVFTREALEIAAQEAHHADLREHVTLYLSGLRPELGCGKFAIGDLTFQANFGHIRWTVDTAQDLERVRRLIAILPDRFTWLDALSAATREPELLGVQIPGRDANTSVGQNSSPYPA